MKKVSIIIPVYNVEAYLKKCLDSLVNQTLKDIEIIIVNDGSPDNSFKIIEEYSKKYPKLIKAYEQENGGQGSARNFGLTKATGEYIGYVDSDDFVELDMYEKLYNKAIQNDYDIVISGNYNVSEDYTSRQISDITKNYNDTLLRALFDKMAVWNKIYKRELLVDNKLTFKSKVWYEDLAFSLKAILLSNKIGFCEEPLYNYLIRMGSTMNNSNVKRNTEIFDAFNDILDFVNKEDRMKYFDEIEFLAINHIYISTTVRVLRADNKEYEKQILKEIIKYMEEKFPNYRKNKYLKTLNKNHKIIYNLINLKMYSIIKLIFKLKKGL